MLGLTRAAAQDVGHRNIRVNCVAPGAIKTPLMLRAWERMGLTEEPPFDEPTSIQRQGTAEDVAAVVVFLLSPESAFVQGQYIAARFPALFFSHGVLGDVQNADGCRCMLYCRWRLEISDHLGQEEEVQYPLLRECTYSFKALAPNTSDDMHLPRLP